MDPVLERYAAMAAPRYTSYPTAPHFISPFSSEVYRDWLAALDLSEPLSLYLHVPFCRQMCWYCGCNMKLVRRYGPVADYVTSLLDELSLVAAAAPGRPRVRHLHFGGGTPTALEPDDLSRVMDAVRRQFEITTDAELALETDPRTLTLEMARRIGALGFTRASFGVQEFDPHVQAAINRIQPPDMVARSVDALREAGVQRINFDLIYGLPHQTTTTIERTVAACVALRPDRLALFGYAHVPWMAKNQRMIPEEALPGPKARAEQSTVAAEALTAAGYVQIGLDHFARPDDALAAAARAGRLRRNFQGYTTDQADALIGVGATAIGRTPQGYVQNISETNAWARSIAAGALPVAKGRPLSRDDRLRGHVIERLMCDGVVDLSEAERRFDVADYSWSDALTALSPLVRDGLVAREGAQIAVTPRGRPYVRVAAAAFDAYRNAGPIRHSAAV